MVSTLKKQLLVLALVAGIAAPISAMEPNQESNGGFGWKRAAGVTVLVSAGVLWAYCYWMKQAPKQQTETLKAALTEEVLPVQEQSDDVVRFNRLPLINKKTTIAQQAELYVESPTQETEDLIRKFAQIYCNSERVKSQALNGAVNKLFAANGKQAKQAECKNIKQLLGLIYY